VSWRAIVERLGMRRHPEGGWYVETWRAPSGPAERPAASAILFLLPAGERSHWHRIDAAEVWQWSAGAPLELRIAENPDGSVETIRLGADVLAGDRPQAVVPVGAWQAAASLGDWTLVGCIVAPAFEFGAFELADPGWEPGPRD
jgi:predicted cupin superfamily sugar epimerase